MQIPANSQQSFIAVATRKNSQITPMPPRMPRIPLLGAAIAAIAVLVTGCAASGAGSGSSAGAGSGSSAAAPAGTSAAPAGATAAPTGTPPDTAGSSTGGTAAAGSAAPACTTSALTAHLGTGEPSAGSTDIPIDFTNTGSTPCTLYGYPGVSLDNSAGQIGAAAQRTAPPPSVALVTLAPGAQANAIVRVADAVNYPVASCSPDPATTLKVYPPNQTQAINVLYTATGCLKPTAKLLFITAVTVGTGNS